MAEHLGYDRHDRVGSDGVNAFRIRPERAEVMLLGHRDQFEQKRHVSEPLSFRAMIAPGHFN